MCINTTELYKRQSSCQPGSNIVNVKAPAHYVMYDEVNCYDESTHTVILSISKRCFLYSVPVWDQVDRNYSVMYFNSNVIKDWNEFLHNDCDVINFICGIKFDNNMTMAVYFEAKIF